MYTLGALQVDTNEYILPHKAEKGKSYECVSCNKKVILKKGNIRKHHFAHYSQGNTCSYYDHPNESELHYDAKHKIAELLKDKKKISITWECPKSVRNGTNCGTSEPDMCHDIHYNKYDKVVVEYRFDNFVADVAVINKGK